MPSSTDERDYSSKLFRNDLHCRLQLHEAMPCPGPNGGYVHPGVKPLASDKRWKKTWMTILTSEKGELFKHAVRLQFRRRLVIHDGILRRDPNRDFLFVLFPFGSIFNN